MSNIQNVYTNMSKIQCRTKWEKINQFELQSRPHIPLDTRGKVRPKGQPRVIMRGRGTPTFVSHTRHVTSCMLHNGSACYIIGSYVGVTG